jgi:hypothetical protein
MVRISESQLQQITQLAKDGYLTVNTNQARIISLADPILGQDAVNLRSLDGYFRSRIINATAPLRINGASSANLGSDATLSITTVSSTTAGVLSASGTVDGVVPQYSTGVGNVTWALIHNNNIADVAWTKITSTPTTLEGYNISAGANYTSLISYGGKTGWGRIADGYISDVSWTKITGAPSRNVWYVSTSNITQSGQVTVDGLTPALGARVLCVAQTNQVQNGIWLVQVGAWARPSDFSSGSAGGIQINVNLGTNYNNTVWLCSNQSGVGGDTIGTNNLTFRQIAPLLSDVYDGIAPKITAANRVLGSSSASASSWIQISDAYISDVSWSKVSSKPSVSTTGPLAGGGSLSSSLTLSITAATTSAAGSMSATDKTKLDGLSISGTSPKLARFTGTTSLGDSTVREIVNNDSVGANAIGIGSAYFGSAFVAASLHKHLAIGTSYFDGTNYITPGVGSNAIAEMITDTSGIGFIVLPVAGSSTRTDTPSTFLGWERFRVYSEGAYVTGKLSVVTPSGAEDTIPAVGVGGTKLSILNAGLYGLLGGVIANGNAFLQVQRVDAQVYTYHMLLQPNGGNVGVGTTNPTATIHSGGSIGMDVVTLQSALTADRELIQAYNVGLGSQLISRHGGGHGNEAITHSNVASSATKAPQIQKYCSQFAASSPSTYTAAINLDAFGANIPANRSFVAKLLFTQHVDEIITSGYSGFYIITGWTLPNGTLSSTIYISSGVTAGTGTAVPTVTVAAGTGLSFTFSIVNTWTGNITGYWQIDVAWVGT